MDQCEAWMKCPTTKCLYWGLILVLLIIVWWSLTSSFKKGTEHMGEWSTALVNQNNHERSAAGMPTIDNGGQEWSDALGNQSLHEKSAMKAMPEMFEGRRGSNVDSREDELMGRLSGGDPWRS